MSAAAPSLSAPPGILSTRAGLTARSSISRDMRDNAGMNQAVEAQGHSRFEARDSEGRVIELDVLLIVMVRRMIGRDDIDAAVRDALQHCVAVSCLTQRRIHLEVRVVRDRRCEPLVGQA